MARHAATSLKHSLLLSSFLLLSLFSTALAQNDGDGNNQSSSSSPGNNLPTPPTPPRPSSNSQTSSRTTNQPPRQTTSQSTSTGAPARITGTNTQTAGGALTGLPRLTNTPIFISYPPPTVPPTVDAPFMQRSSLPDGTVFIAVGAILGAFGAAIVIWRGIVACLLHRSVERAASAQHNATDKAANSFPAPPAPFYKYTDRDSSPSLGGTPVGRGVRRTTRGPTPSATPSQTNLFFSPTAASGAGLGAGRDSRFLPSGFYAANSPSPNPGHGHSISLTNLRPDSRGNYGGASRTTMRDPSPPDSPIFTARREASTSSLNINRPPSQRAPSAYLEDLLDDNPHAFPPPQPGPRHAHTFSHTSTSRY